MPRPLLEWYMVMLPRLQAEEQLQMIGVVAAGTGSFKPADHKRYVRELERTAEGGRRQRAARATAASLAAIGIQVEVEEVPASASG
jgi:hypothetical protein